MELEELHEKTKKPKRFYLLLQAEVEGWHLYLEKRVDAVSKQDAWHQVQHNLVSANNKYVDLSELNWRVRRINVIGPSKTTHSARRRVATKDSE
jgi:hypothetical protein